MGFKIFQSSSVRIFLKPTPKLAPLTPKSAPKEYIILRYSTNHLQMKKPQNLYISRVWGFFNTAFYKAILLT